MWRTSKNWEELEACPDPFKDKVKCEECKCWLDKYDAKKLTVYGVFGKYENLYCKSHAPKYDEMHTFSPDITYFGRCEVSKDGTPIIKKP